METEDKVGGGDIQEPAGRSVELVGPSPRPKEVVACIIFQSLFLANTFLPSGLKKTEVHYHQVKNIASPKQKQHSDDF